MMHWLCRIVDQRRVFSLISLHKIPEFHLIFWCQIFVERHSFRGRIARKSVETVPFHKISTPEDRGNFGILRSVSSRDPRHKKKAFTFTEEILNGKLHFLCSEHCLRLAPSKISYIPQIGF